MRSLDLVGQRFDRLVVTARAVSRNGSSYWLCQCDCGNSFEAKGSKLTESRTKSCGCMKADVARELGRVLNRSHGMTGTLEYSSWQNMKSRCLNANTPCFDGYGGRGIGVDPRWVDSFENFFADMGPAPSPDHSIERDDVNGNYSPSNCRWATTQEQANNKRTSVFFQYQGQRYTRTQLCALTGINPSTFQYRIDCGKSIEEALRC